jgi:hypothetical protein
MGKEIQDTILVSVDFTNGEDLSVMVVGRKRPNESVEIINALQGKEAEDLYSKLVTPVKKV